MIMAVEEDSALNEDEFKYSAAYLRHGFSKLATQSSNDENEVLYQSSRDYAETPVEEWTADLVEKAQLYLSKHILNPRHTAKILFLFEQSILKVIRYALSSDADHQMKISALRIILKYKPNIIHHCLSYFDGKLPPWEKEDSALKTPKRMKFPNSEISDYEIVESCWLFLKSNLSYFRDKWNWADFIQRFIPHHDLEICWMACQCAAIVLAMNENTKLTFIQKYMSIEEHYEFAIQHEVSKQASHSIATETLNYDTNPSRCFMPLYKQNVAHLTVDVAGVTLDVINPENQVKEGCLIETKSTLYNLRRIAIALSSGKAVCLTGPVGSGKTSLVSHLALLTGRDLNKDLLKVQLGEETDSKLLLGSYQCTDIPGEFVWTPGMLTKALVEGRWLLLEDIGSATSDVAALLANLLEEKSISVPGFRDSLQPAPGFHLFVTHRLVNYFNVHQKRDTCSMELLERHWLQIHLEPLTRDELVQVIQTKYPVLKTIAAQMTTVYLLFSQGNHEEESAVVQAGTRMISTRDLFKWCRRAVMDFDVSSVESALKVLQDAIDIFCSSYSSQEVRLELASQVAACLGIIRTKAEYFCGMYKPSINLTPTSCVAGRASLPLKELKGVSSLKSLTEGLKFAMTRGSSCLLERVAVCLSLDEPALLVGETGTGKTTTLQLLARQTGHTLVVINMNQQSDSSHLLGGYKPIDTKQVIAPLRNEFEELFRSFFNVEKNLKFLENLSVCMSNRRFLTLLKLMITSQKAAVKRLKEGRCDEALLSKWLKLGEKLYKLQTQLKQSEAAMAFSFVEGSLIQAMKAGHWVLLDEINLASAETLQCLSGLLEGSTIHLLERGDEASIQKHPDFRIMAAMNPATDFGKKDLPPGIRNRFTEIFVSEHTEKGDLGLVVNCYLPDQPPAKVNSIVDFYLNVRKCAVEILSDGSGNRPHYSLRTLCRALVVASENRCGSIPKSLFEGLCLGFLTQLNPASHKIVSDMIARTVAEKGDIKSIMHQPIPEPVCKQEYICFEGYWVPKGRNEPHIPKSYILSESVKRNLRDLARVVSLSSHPVLLQGGTSVGKTSLIIYLAEASGHRALRINNHQHTDLQEYIGSYAPTSQSASLVFKEGVLAQAMRRGDWIILDELNLAPSEVLEALNRVLDDNRELFIPETSVTIKAHPDFRIFATQNPPGTYGGRKMLSRAFRNRFVELHFGEIPPVELAQILHQRCHMPQSYCKKLVAVMSDLQLRRRGSAAFAGKEGYITLRDLFRWGERYRLASDRETFYDWDQHVADEGFLVLAGRVRKIEEQNIIKSVIEKHFKCTIDLTRLFTLNENTSPVTKPILEKIVSPPLPNEFKHLVWTFNLRKLAVLVGKALVFKEPILLVGETGCGKTTICQLLAVINKQLLYSVNCHQHSESSDFLGGLRPIRDKAEKSGKLFEWVDGPLIQAMKDGHMFLVDEISLADDSVLERLNSLLEPERTLLVSEKGSGDDIEIVAKDEFLFIGTMNPGGDFGKKELSPALRNRLTEIWCEVPSSEEDLIAIIEHNIQPGIVLKGTDGTSGFGKAIIQFLSWFSSTDLGKRNTISVRTLLVWVNFINVTVERGTLDPGGAFFHGACLVLLDGVGAAGTSSDDVTSLQSFKWSCYEHVFTQLKEVLGKPQELLIQNFLTPEYKHKCSIVDENDSFGVAPFMIKKVISKEIKDFLFYAPTTRVNLMRLLRGLEVASRAILLEGSPGVGKTSLVLALAKVTGNKVTRINLSEQTDISDLFGSDLPVEGAEGGTFAWSDGPFLRALKEGHWILLDELNLASQSVIEGLNSVLDHRGEIFIPDLGRTFKVQAEKTKLFACQNPQRQGGARKGLPQSFLNRFTQVFVEPLSKEDMKWIMNSLYPICKQDLLEKMVDFHDRLCLESWSGYEVWDFNLRDLIRWGESLSHVMPGVAVETIYAARMSNKKDRQRMMDIYREIFGNNYPLADSLSPVLISPSKLTIGEVNLPRVHTNDYSDTFNGKDLLLILRDQQPAFKSLALCVKMGWMSILIGKSGSGKTSLVHLLSQIAGKKVNTLPVSSAMDTTDLLGGFEQTDLWRHLERLGRQAERLVLREVRSLLTGSAPDGKSQAAVLLSLWHGFLVSGQLGLSHCYQLKENEEKLRERCRLLGKVVDGLAKSDEAAGLASKLTSLQELLQRSGLQAGGVFEWVDSLLVRCVEEGEWLLLENVNLCSGAVLDRLNSLLEKGGSLLLGERGGPSSHLPIHPHPDFRVFLTVDPRRGLISRAMRNRGVEIYLDSPNLEAVHPFDLDSMLFNCGLTMEQCRHALKDIQNKIIARNIGPEQPGLGHLLQLVYISCQNWKQGFSLYESVKKASVDIYIKSRLLSPEQRMLMKQALDEIVKSHEKHLSEPKFTTLDCFWPKYKTPTTLSIQEDSHVAIALQHSAILLAILRLFERVKFTPNWPNSFSLRDIFGSDILTYLKHYNTKYINLEMDILNLVPYLLLCYYSCASSVDILVRKKWLDKTVNHIIRSHPYSDRLSSIFDKILHISNIIYSTLSPWNTFRERPWDVRHIKHIDTQDTTTNFSRENKIFALMCYKIIQATFHTNEDRDVSSLRWKQMSAIEFSKALEKDATEDWPCQERLIVELYPLLTAFDDMLVSALCSEQVSLPDEDCAQLVFRLSWRFKLSTVGERRLFKAASSASAQPTVSEETLSLIRLHYSWFKKHTVSFFLQLTHADSALSHKVNDFHVILNSIDSSLNDGSVHLVPVARKFRKLYLQPTPKSSSLQFQLSQKLFGFESSIGIWRDSSQLLKNINFLASETGERVRQLLIQSAIILFENCQLDLLEPKMLEIEKEVKALREEEEVATDTERVMKMKVWPLMELVCLRLATGVQRQLLTNEKEGLGLYLVEALGSWLQATPSVPPFLAAFLQDTLNRCTFAECRDNTELMYYLADYPNISPAYSFPQALLDWEHTLATDKEGYSLLDNKGLYMDHMPLLSLFLSKIISGIPAQQDSPSFALKAHKNTTKMIHLIKLLLWRNLPAIYSTELNSRTNETQIFLIHYASLLTKLKKALNSKKKDLIVSESLPDLAKEIVQALEKMNSSHKSNLERGVFSSLSELARLAREMSSGENKARQEMLLGEAWSHLGRVSLFLYAFLEPVDPVKKQAIKKQYVSQEVSELEMLLCAEELDKLLVGAPLRWPLKGEYEKRITTLRGKYSSDVDRADSIRPAISLYPDIIKDVLNLTSVLLPDDIFIARLTSLMYQTRDVPCAKRRKSPQTKPMRLEKGFDPAEAKAVLAEFKSWLVSLNAVSEKLYLKYYVQYPDIIVPVLMALSQMSHGLRLLWTCAQKKIFLNTYLFIEPVDFQLKLLSSFPIVDLDSALEILRTCSSPKLNFYLTRCKDVTDSQQDRIKLIKISIKIIRSLTSVSTLKLEETTFFQLLDQVVTCWHKLQEKEKLKKAQEDSIYINKMKPTEEELMEREKRELFPSSREKDFGDLERPDTLEGSEALPTEEFPEKDPIRLSSEEIQEICLIHSEVVRAAATGCHWLSRLSPLQQDPVDLLKDRLSVYTKLLNSFFEHGDSETDSASLPALLVALEPLVRQAEGEVTSSKDYDFYRDSNLKESKACVPLLTATLKRVRELLVDWPDHPTLKQMEVVIERVMGFRMTSPLSRFLTGLELLLGKLHQWEENAHAGVSLAQHQASLVQQIIAWRKLELSAWKGALSSVHVRVETKCRKFWFHIFSLVTEFARGSGKESQDTPEEEQSQVPETEEELRARTEELVKALEGFMESSSLGDFSVRLDLLHVFHCHCILLPHSNRRDILVSVLWNIHSFYKLFKNSILKTIEDLTAGVKKKVKDFVKIARWNDINYWAVKAAIEKTHHTLLKHIKEYEKILNEPARGAMTRMAFIKVSSKMNLSSLKMSNYLSSCSLPEMYSDTENAEESLLKLQSLFRRSRSLSTKLMRGCSYSKLLDNFELLIDDIEETGKLLNELDIDPSIPNDKKKSAFKALLQRKRKNMADLFKSLNQIGLSYRTGMILYEQKNIDFAKIQPFDIGVSLDVIDKMKSDKDWLSCWKGTENYFYTAVAKLAVLKMTLEKPHKDLGPQLIERIKGFSSHSNHLLQNLKGALGESVLSLYTVRCQTIQLLNLAQSDYGMINSDISLNRDTLVQVLENIMYCLRQFLVVLEACPEEEVKLPDSTPVPVIFSDDSKYGMVNAYKHDPVWESTRAKVEAIISLADSQLKEIISLDKHKSFIKNSRPSKDFNVDAIVNEREFNIIEDGFDALRKIYSLVCDVDKLFEQTVCGKVLSNNPLSKPLHHIKSQIDIALSTHKEVEYSGNPDFKDFSELVSSVPNSMKEKIDNFLNKVLVIIQNIFKTHVSESKPKETKSEDVELNDQPEEEEKEIIVDGHLKEKIIESLLSDLKTLRISEISEDISSILAEISTFSDENIQKACQGLFFHVHPLLDQLISVYNYFIVQLTASVKILGKFSVYFISVFADFAKNGYRIPEEMMEGEEGEGQSEGKGGLGLGEGEGEKDVSDQIESEDQLEDARRPGDYGQEEEKDCKEEEKGIEMSEDFDSKLQDMEKKEEEEGKSDGESDKEEELDKEMGDTETGADVLDKQIWGSDSEEEDEEEEGKEPKDEKGSRGEQETEKELGAKEDEEKEEVGEKEDGKKKEPKEKEINEMDEPQVDDDQIDPYHGKQQPSPEVEPLDLGEDEMNLDDEEDKGSEDGDEENPFDIDTMKKKIEDKEEEGENEEGKEEEEDKDDDAEDDEKGEESEEQAPEVKGPEKEQEEGEEEEGDEQKDEDAGEPGDKEEDLEEETGQAESAGVDELPTQQQAEQSQQKFGSKDQVKSNEDPSGDTEMTEETKAEGKEQSGSGKAEQMDTESGGHKGETGKRKKAGERERKEKKQRPGQSEMERSLGEANEPVKKKLKTIGISKDDKEQESKEGDERLEEDMEAEAYQHIHEAKESQYDAQTVDAATQEQAEKQPPKIGKDDEEKEEMGEDDVINVLDEDEMEIDVETVDEQESSTLQEAESQPDAKTKNKGEGGGPLEEAKVEVEGEYAVTSGAERGLESSYHTRLTETTVREPMSEAELHALRHQLQGQLGSWAKRPRKEEAMAAWEKVCRLTAGQAQQLSEELRLVLEPTTASSLRGDFRTGKRINMRKVIPYIASQFRKDKIWLRRTKPSKRDYQIILAIDDSSSMADNHSKELAFESLAVVSKALNLIEAGELAVISFGEDVRVLHQLGEPFTETSGARLMEEFSFDEKRTRVGAAVETALALTSQRQLGPHAAQLLVIVSDGRGVMSEGEEAVRRAVRAALHSRLFIVFLVIDSPNSKDSILDIRMPRFSGGKLIEVKPYMDSFPFPFYLILRDIASLPTVLSDALRQWFELVTDLQ